jgi:hypothetical protein
MINNPTTAKPLQNPRLYYNLIHPLRSYRGKQICKPLGVIILLEALPLCLYFKTSMATRETLLGLLVVSENKYSFGKELVIKPKCHPK